MSEEEKTWYHHKDQNREYYTPFTNFKSVYTFVKDTATSEEKCKILNENSLSDYLREGIFRSRSKESEKKPEILPPGVYRYLDEAYGPSDLPERLDPIDLRTDSYIDLKGPFEKIEQDIIKFLNNKEFYETKNLIFKLGILLYGSPGQGKTVFLRKIVKELIPKDSVVIFIPDLPTHDFLEKLKNSIKNYLKVFIFEEFAATTSSTEKIEPLLSFLDGESSMQNSIIIATTNYPEKIPLNIIDRPSRFDKLYDIDSPSDSEIKKLFSFFLNQEITPEQIKIVKGLSIASIKEVALLIQLHKKTLEEAVATLKERSIICKKQFAKPVKLGFGFNPDSD